MINGLQPKSNILVTGGAGFIGREVTKCFVQHGHSVDIHDTLQACYNNFTKVENFANGEVFVDNELNSLYDYDAIIHCAAICDTRCTDVTALHNNNVKLTKTLLAAKRKDIPFIFLSSASVYGTLPCDPNTEKFMPQTRYAYSKLIAEGHAKEYDNTVIVRPFNVYGPGEFTKAENTRSIIYKMCDAYREGEGLDLHSLNAKRDFIHVSSVAEAIYTMLYNWKSYYVNHPINLGSGHSVSIKWLADYIGLEYDVIDNPYGSAYQDNTVAINPFKTIGKIEFQMALEASINEMIGRVV